MPLNPVPTLKVGFFEKLYLFLCIFMIFEIPPSFAYMAADPCGEFNEPTISIFSNNVGMFPALTERVFFPKKLQEQRRKMFVYPLKKRAWILGDLLFNLKEDPDVIVLQELWSARARRVVHKKLKSKYPFHRFDRSPGKYLLGLNSGLALFSKFPIKKSILRHYRVNYGNERFAKKGLMGVELQVGDEIVFIFHTHMQAGHKNHPGESATLSQLREADTWIKDFTSRSPNSLILYAGDFNISNLKPEYDQIFRNLNHSEDSFCKLSPLPHTSTRGNLATKRIDYILTMTPYQGYSRISDAIPAKIADHRAVFGIFNF